MNKFKIILFTIIFLISNLKGNSNEIQVSSFTELINSNPINGDTIDVINDLSSYESINNNFINLDISFQGNNHSLDGNNAFSGFILNKESLFNQLEIKNCKGQRYTNSSFAGAVFNSGGEMNIQNSSFNNNFVDSSGLNFGVGGAVYNLNGGTVNINNSLFENNYTNGASSYGGAIANGYQNTDEYMTINNSIFKNNYSYGSAVPYGGALYNQGSIDINNTLFDGNYAEGEDRSFVYGGSIFNTGNMTLNNSTLTNSNATGGNNSYVFGGAIYNSGNLTINNSNINNNTANCDTYADGGAIYNYVNSTLTISNSTLSNNKISSNAQFGEGGGINNLGRLVIENSTLENNYGYNGEQNDIYNNSSGIIDFDSDGTTNILSGIKGEGTINKNGSGVLNLGGTNNSYTGNLNINEGTINLLANSSYFQAQNTNFANNINFNMQNGVIDNINYGNLNVSGTANIYPDVNLNTNTMDTISASSFSGGGKLFVPNLDIEGVPKGEYITIPFADSTLKDYVLYNTSTINTPIYNYQASYNSSNGDFDFRRNGLNPSILNSSVATQLGGYLCMLDTYKNVFSNLDMVMIMPPEERISFELRNKSANANNLVSLSPLVMPEQNNGIWFKPYSTFETVGLNNGPKVQNISYGSLIGGESGLRELKNKWYNLYGGYVSYNGSHQYYEGNGIYNNGGLLGADTVFYKGNFFSAWTANVGANVAEANTNYGNDEFAMLMTGIAQKTGFNFYSKERHFVIQPSILTSYSFINTFNYHTASNVSMNTEPLHAIHIEPQIKLIWNLKNFWQPYVSVSMNWNIIDKTKFQADNVFLPNLSVKPFVQYGIGIQKRWGERLTGFAEAMLRNGGRNGVALQMGFRLSF